MSSHTAGRGSWPDDLSLTPHQQNLLLAALRTNKEQGAHAVSENGFATAPPPSTSSPVVQLPGDASFEDSPYLDSLDYDFVDSSFDLSFASSEISQETAHAITKALPETDNNEKRSHPGDETDATDNDSKRHESPEKAPKKPGRKPLISEPTTKRKAQNRAAQRAFRERKEKHLRDLENKVEELEKESEAANHENNKLRAQLDRTNAELNIYKQKMAILMKPDRTAFAHSREGISVGSIPHNDVSNVNFNFEFPKFGTLPGPPANKAATAPTTGLTSTAAKTSVRSTSQTSLQGQSPNSATSQGKESKSLQPTRELSQPGSAQDVTASRLDGLTPALKAPPTTVQCTLDSSSALSGAISSPSASSNSNLGHYSSSCTSPEPTNQSPMGFKSLDTLTIIGEEHTPPAKPENSFAQLSNTGPSFDWLAQQNGGQFDPQLFGDYREPQDSILANPSFDELLNDSLDADFITPYYTAPVAPKKNLIEEIDAQQDALDDEPVGERSFCNHLWEKLKDCPETQGVDIDLDGLCYELTKKAKCSGNGPVVEEKDLDSICMKYIGEAASPFSLAKSLNIVVKKEDQPNGVTLL